ncbi:hypothetical protein [Dysgonomonas sp. 520]|uniref:hypothetical protein n=1 Tax=Dysgonomonas sp. 520 TaxID=2302931 RepID=UPI0013D7054E|nr:hypothetical protein [Dysgonomonas sp. 520]NDW09323.1 hypothetical protein [Dysgonomonas sp. 520]
MKKLIFIFILCSISIMSYSQDALRLTTKSVYVYDDQRSYTYKVSFYLDSDETLEIIAERKDDDINGVYSVASSKNTYDNELGNIFHFFVEKKQITGFEHIPPKQYILTITKEYITFTPRNKNTINELYLFEK